MNLPEDLQQAVFDMAAHNCSVRDWAVMTQFDIEIDDLEEIMSAREFGRCDDCGYWLPSSELDYDEDHDHMPVCDDCRCVN